MLNNSETRTKISFPVAVLRHENDIQQRRIQKPLKHLK